MGLVGIYIPLFFWGVSSSKTPEDPRRGVALLWPSDRLVGERLASAWAMKPRNAICSHEPNFDQLFFGGKLVHQRLRMVMVYVAFI